MAIKGIKDKERLADSWSNFRVEVKRPNWRSRSGAFIIVALVVVGLGKFLGQPISFNSIDTFNSIKDQETIQLQSDGPFEWDSVIPSKELNYTPCYDKFLCTRLLVPMDWNASEWNSSEEDSVAIAMIKLPGNVSVLDPSYGGEIYLNPGGPGGSGVDFLVKWGEYLQQIVSPPGDGKVFDIVSFDPRGVGRTTPRFSCFSDVVEKQMWARITDDDTIIGTSDNVLAHRYSRSKAYGWLCSGNQSSNPIKYHVSTPYVARDMIEMVELSGALREKTVYKEANQMGQKLTTDVLDRVRHQKGEEKIQYWGFSYGTFLGTTFASMYPSRIHRMVLDAVVDADDYSSGDWKRSIWNTDEALKSFYESCYEAGSILCPMFDSDGPLAIEATTNRILLDLLKMPIPLQGSKSPLVFTYSRYVVLILAFLYTPHRTFPILASSLAMLRDGNTAGLAEFLESPAMQCSEDLVDHNIWATDTGTAVRCQDGSDLRNETITEVEKYYEEIQQQSKMFSGLMTDARVGCIGWDIRPKWRYDGPFTGEPSHPILWMNNIYDPVTPAANAFKMASRFVGSGVLTQEATGHGAIMIPSHCIAKHTRDYFTTGVLPKNGTICKPDKTPFGSPIKVEGIDDTLSEALERLSYAELPTWFGRMGQFRG